MPADRLLREATSIGLTAMEAGPEEFLPQDPDEVRELLAEHNLGLVGGFVPAVLHDPQARQEGLDLVERRAEFFSEAGADTLVLAAMTGSETLDEVVELDEAGWEELFENLARVDDICARYDLTAVLHSHFGAVVETDEQLWRFLEGSDMGLCLDTGHLVIGGSDPLEVAEKAADRVKHVHLKDVDMAVARRGLSLVQAVQAGLFRPLGAGDVRLDEVLEGLDGYARWLVLEQDTALTGEEPPVGRGPVTDVRTSIEYLHSLAPGRRERVAES